jgi:hypothetical protein
MMHSNAEKPVSYTGLFVKNTIYINGSIANFIYLQKNNHPG